jgi:hypothetical protein
MPTTDKMYSILIDLQRQIGNLSRETGEQTEIIKAVQIQTTKTNGRVTALEVKLEGMDQITAFSKGKKAATIALIGAVSGILVTLLVAFIKQKLGL